MFIIPALKFPLFHYSSPENLIIPFHKISLFRLHVGSRSPAISSGWVRLGDPLAGYLDGKMLANVLSNARNTLFDPLPQIQNYIIPLFQGNVIVDDYSKGNVVIPEKPRPLFHYSTAKISVILIPLFLFSPRF